MRVCRSLKAPPPTSRYALIQVLAMGRIDVHHHFFPVDLKKETSNRNIGWRTPAGTLPWTPEISLKAMDASGIDLALLSLPASPAGSVSEENRSTTRERNVHASRIVRAHPDRFGFFASLPFLDDVEGQYKPINIFSCSRSIQAPLRKLHMLSTSLMQTG
jgi:predicted TIM-barrel fold metal-dependent hydrolase